jgi:transcriptional regulator with XRE-family HTH domain
MERATYRIRRVVRELGEEYREARYGAGLSQRRVASEAGISRSRYTRIEAGRISTLRLEEAARVGAVLGLDLSVKVYPGGGPLRDQGHHERLGFLLSAVASPLAPGARSRSRVARVCRNSAPGMR